jgi:hypothetical protein
MRLKKLYGDEGWLRVHMDDDDQYEITDDNGVDVDLSPGQIIRIVRWVLKKAPGLAGKITGCKLVPKGSYLITDADIAELIDYADAEDGPACIRSICEKIKAGGRS